MTCTDAEGTGTKHGSSRILPADGQERRLEGRQGCRCQADQKRANRAGKESSGGIGQGAVEEGEGEGEASVGETREMSGGVSRTILSSGCGALLRKVTDEGVVF